MTQAPPAPRGVLLARRCTPATDRTVRVALVLTAVFGLLHAWMQLTWRGRHVTPESLRSWFNLLDDYSIPSWFGWWCFFAAGYGCIRWSRAQRASVRRQLGQGLPVAAPVRRRVTCSLLVGLFFCYLGLDDMLMLHEQLGAWIAAHWHEHFAYAWVLVIGPVFVAVGAWAFVTCWRGLHDDRGAQLRLFAGFACLGVSMVLELFEAQTKGSGLRLRGLPLVEYSQFVEEMVEFIGPILVFSATAGAAEMLRARLAAPAP
jgi:hypothetical protein